MNKFLLSLAFVAISSSAYAAPGTEPVPSGVTVTRTKPGTGAQPVATDTVTVNYRGTLANGTEFDSSYKRGTPASFPLGQVVPCWTQGLQKMKVGETARLVCPPATAYGGRCGAPSPPNLTHTFGGRVTESGH